MKDRIHDEDTEKGLVWIQQQIRDRSQSRHIRHKQTALLVSVLLVIALFWTGFIQALFAESARLEAELIFWRMKGPPVDCGLDAPRSIDVDAWSQWVIRALWMDTRDRDCIEFIERVNRSTWPNLMMVMSSYVSRVIIIPLHDLFHLLSSLSYVLQIWIVIGMVLLGGLYWFFSVPLKLLQHRLSVKEERMADL
jgi:hypothetical protein